jgi:hypothetical protein
MQLNINLYRGDMPTGIPLNEDDVIRAIHKNKGVLTHAARMIGCNPDAIFSMVNRSQKVKEARDDARKLAHEERLDKCEYMINEAHDSSLDLLLKRDVTMTIFIMKTLGKLIEGHSSGNIIINKIERPYADDNRNNDSPSISVS